LTARIGRTRSVDVTVAGSIEHGRMECPIQPLCRAFHGEVKVEGASTAPPSTTQWPNAAHLQNVFARKLRRRPCAQSAPPADNPAPECEPQNWIVQLVCCRHMIRSGARLLITGSHSARTRSAPPPPSPLRVRTRLHAGTESRRIRPPCIPRASGAAALRGKRVREVARGAATHLIPKPRVNRSRMADRQRVGRAPRRAGSNLELGQDGGALGAKRAGAQ
jgi:hypothetical protein